MNSQEEVLHAMLPSVLLFVLLTKEERMSPRRIGGAAIALSIQRPATGWMVRGSNHGGGEVFRTRPDPL